MPAPSFEHPAEIITTQEGLEALVERLLLTDRVAIDTESDNFYRYHKKVCLLQITAGDQDYIVDPLAIEDLRPFGRVLTSTQVVKVFHAGENDLSLFMHTLGLRLAPPYLDTYVAAQLAGEKKVGFGALVEKYFGVQLDKRFQLHDWAERPISEEALDYARGDTHFLLPLWDKIWADVQRLGREPHTEEELERMLERVQPAPPFDPDGCLKLKGTRALNATGFRVLRQLYVMREEIASAKDKAPFRVLANDVLVALAQSRPTTKAALNNLPLSRDRGVKRMMDEIVEAINVGMDPSAPQPAQPQRGAGGPPDRALEERLKVLKGWRNTAAEKLDLSPGLVANNALLTELAARTPRDAAALQALPGVRKWQLAEFGEAWISLFDHPAHPQDL